MVARIAKDTRIRQLAESIANAAARLELKTFAECVETGKLLKCYAISAWTARKGISSPSLGFSDW